jgi:hypothetical protein
VRELRRGIAKRDRNGVNTVSVASLPNQRRRSLHGDKRCMKIQRSEKIKLTEIFLVICLHSHLSSTIESSFLIATVDESAMRPINKLGT